VKPGEWSCDGCGGVFDESQGYAEINDGDAYLCERCAEKSGTELTVRT
jgi:NAD-dependent SIR2 family protein deacetylase